MAKLTHMDRQESVVLHDPKCNLSSIFSDALRLSHSILFFNIAAIVYALLRAFQSKSEGDSFWGGAV